MSRNASSPMGKKAGRNADRDTRKKAGSGARTAASAVVGPDELSKEDLKLAAEAQAASGDWHDGPPPGKAEAFWPSFKRMVGLLGAYRVSLVVVALAAVGTVVLAVAAPKVLGQATNVIFEGVVSTMLPAGTTKAQAVEALRARGMDDFATMLSAMDVIPGAGIDYTRLGRILTVVLGLYVGSGLLNWLQGWLINRITIKALYRLRAQVEDKVHRLPLSYFDTVQRGELLSRLTNDVDNVTNTLQQSLSGALTAILTVVGVLGMMFSISWKLALVALIMFPLMGVVFGVIGPRSQKAFTHQWARTGKINTRVEESFSGHALVQVYGRTASVREAFAAENEELFRASLRAQFLSGIMMPIMLVIGNINYVAIAVVGGAMVASGSLRLGDVQAFIQYSQQFSQPLGQLGGMATAVQSGTASAERARCGHRVHGRRRGHRGGRRQRRGGFAEEPGGPGCHRDGARALLLQPGGRAHPGPVAAGRPRPHGRDRGAHGSGQDHPGQPAHALLRARRRPHPARRARHRHHDAPRRAPSDRHGPAGPLAVRRHDPREHPLRAPRSHR